jgi:hypothetical protein
VEQLTVTGTPLITQTYTLAATQFRVWDLLASSILQSMPVEQTEIINDSTMRGVLRFKFAGLTIPLNLKVEVADVSPMDSFTTLVTVTKWGTETVLRVKYDLTVVGDEQIQVSCTATIEKAPAWMALVSPIQKSFAAKMFEDIRKEIERAV